MSVIDSGEVPLILECIRWTIEDDLRVYIYDTENEDKRVLHTGERNSPSRRPQQTRMLVVGQMLHLHIV